MVTLTVLQVRRALLAAQGLTSEQAMNPSAADVLAAIRRMHALQIDTISVVARSPYLVLWSRLGDYEPAIVDRLLADHAIFEHWSHAACFLEVDDYPLYRRMMLDGQRRSYRKTEEWLEANRTLVDGLLAHIRANGPVRSADFARPDGQKGSGWWDWKVEKLALELLNTRGDLMVSERRNFQRVYDLRERVVPKWDDSLAPPLEEAHRALAVKAVRALGVARAPWVVNSLESLTLGQAATRARLESLADEGALIRGEVDGWSGPVYVHPDDLGLLDLAARCDAELRTTLLSPFDPIVRDRARALEMFGFDYRIECYTPAPARKYGYFSLPILHGTELVGRLDPKAHRRDGVFEVKSLHLEPGVPITDELATGLRETLTRIAAWHGTPDVVIRETYPPKLRSALTRKRPRANSRPAS